MAQNEPYDLVVIGGGPAGYAAAIRAGQLGKKAACVEVERLGGACLNWGCIPSKALLKSAEIYQKMLKADDYGLSCEKPGFDFAKVILRSRKVVDQMARGIEFLFRKNKVDYVVGRGRISAPGIVEVTDGKDKGRSIEAKNILLATGCAPRRIPGVALDGERILTSREALVLQKQPKSLLIIGAGAIGVEFAYFFNAFGTNVTLVELLPQVIPAEDEECALALTRGLRKQGIEIHTSTKVENPRVEQNSVHYELVGADGKSTSGQAEAALIAIGVAPNMAGALSPQVKIDLDELGFVKVDAAYATNIAGIYAAGDIIGPPLLAHVGTFEAVQAVNGMFGHSVPKSANTFPRCAYCRPQVASQGLTEKLARERGIKYKVGKFPFAASGKAVASNEAEGFIKILSAEETGEIIGVHIIGSEATELIAEFGLAMSLKATVEDIHGTIHAHPTLAEAAAEAAGAVIGQAIHI